MEFHKANKIFLVVAVVAALAAVVTGFLLIGSPADQRKSQADDKRVLALSSVASGIYSYTHLLYDKNGKRTTSTQPLPVSLDRIYSQFGYVPEGGGGPNFSDPITGQAYEYTRLDGMRYELCATFETDSALARQKTQGKAPGAVPTANPARLFWDHPAGRYCYALDASQPSPPTYPAFPIAL